MVLRFKETKTTESRESPDIKPENELFRKDLRDVLQWVLRMASENHSDENKTPSEVKYCVMRLKSPNPINF